MEGSACFISFLYPAQGTQKPEVGGSLKSAAHPLTGSLLTAITKHMRQVAAVVLHSVHSVRACTCEQGAWVECKRAALF